MKVAYKRLGDMLVSVGLITEEQLQQALDIQKETGARLGSALTSSGIISEAQLIDALEVQLGVEFIDLSKIIIDSELANVVPKNLAKKHNVVPVRQDRDELYLAMSDPLNYPAIEDIKHATKCKVIPMIATGNAVDRAIASLYGNEGAARAIEEMRKEAGESEYTSVMGVTSVEVDDQTSAPTIRLVNSIIERAITERASDIHMEPQATEMVVRMRIDGMLRNILTVPSDLMNSVISRLKVMGGMDTSERRIPQDGRSNVRVKDKNMDLRISTLPCIYGEKMVIRLLDKTGQILTREGIGLKDRDSDKIDEILKSTSGVILITGPTGSGKSSTMSTLVRELNTPEVNIVTLEDPVEYDVPGVNQVQINEKTGMTFANGLRSILRQDPDIISVGEIRDGETADIAMRAAITGHLVISTIHTNDSVSTLDRLYDIGVEPYLTSSALRGIISQRLVRKICPQCRKGYTPSQDELDNLGLTGSPKDRTFYKGEGCPMCYHTGYQGRTGVFEILVIDRDLRSLITKRAGREEVMAAAKAKGFRTLYERCLDMVTEGTTTVSEALRTINSADQ